MGNLRFKSLKSYKRNLISGFVLIKNENIFNTFNAYSLQVLRGNLSFKNRKLNAKSRFLLIFFYFFKYVRSYLYILSFHIYYTS